MTINLRYLKNENRIILSPDRRNIQFWFFKKGNLEKHDNFYIKGPFLTELC